MALWRPNPFLAMVAVFSFYFSFTARRVLLSRRPDRGERATALDRGAAVAAAVTSAALVVLGAVQPGAVWVRLGPVGWCSACSASCTPGRSFGGSPARRRIRRGGGSCT